MTVEDPVEFNLPGINQVPINKAAGESAATVLRSLHHVDADVILVGEIRDSETARVAFSLAEQGHLVLSTLPTSDAASTVTHLLSDGDRPVPGGDEGQPDPGAATRAPHLLEVQGGRHGGGAVEDAHRHRLHARDRSAPSRS